MNRKWIGYIFLGMVLALPGAAQDIEMFFGSDVLEETTDEYGNTYVTTPVDAVIPLPEGFGESPELELEGLIVDPAYIYETYTDDAGNSYTTVAQDDSLSPEEVFVEGGPDDDNLWNLRGAAMPDMGVLESYAPSETEDAPPVQTTVTMGEAGTYNVYLWYGDIGAANPDDDADNPTPINAGLEGEDMQTFLQADGVLITDEYGWNVLEVQLGTVTLEAGESFSVIIDDHFGEGARSAYLGLRISTGPIYDPPEPPSYDFHQDDKWLSYTVAGERTLLLSNGPGADEDAPELTTEITLGHAGTYEVIFHFMDSNNFPDQGWIRAALDDNDPQDYGAGHPDAVRATGGTSPAYPWIDGTFTGGMFWYTAVMGTVEAEAGDTITLSIDDAQGTAAEPYIASVFEGITLRVLEGGPPITEIRVSPGEFEWFTDKNGNQYRTWAMDEDAYPNLEDWLTDHASSSSDNKWNIRDDLGIFGPIIESFPGGGTEDAPPLRTTVIPSEGGTYDVYYYFGDTGASDPEENLELPHPTWVYFEGEDPQTLVAGDGEFVGLHGYNTYEIYLGQITVEAGEEVNVIIDDGFEHELSVDGSRSVYCGLLLETAETSVDDWELF